MLIGRKENIMTGFWLWGLNVYFVRVVNFSNENKDGQRRDPQTKFLSLVIWGNTSSEQTHTHTNTLSLSLSHSHSHSHSLTHSTALIPNSVVYNVRVFRSHVTSEYFIEFPNLRIVLFLLFCTLTNRCTIISQIITLLHISTLSFHP